jgi:hypothetical protein
MRKSLSSKMLLVGSIAADATTVGLCWIVALMPELGRDQLTCVMLPGFVLALIAVVGTSVLALREW